MKLKILYFGMISEITNCSEEVLSVLQDCNLYQLEIELKEKYQHLKNISFKIAVDKAITNSDIQLTPNNEIALLPPFAGG